MGAFGDYDFAPSCELIRANRKIMIVGHVSPDGDTLGSSLALSCGLQQLGKETTVVFQDDVPAHLQFLPGADAIIKPEQITEQPELLILVDCAALSRTGAGWIDKYLQGIPLLIFDHHALRDDIPSVSVIDPRLAATGELIYWLLKALGVDFDVDIARCVYTAICTDTGGFRFTNTKVHTHQIAAEMLGLGVKLEEMRIQLFESRSIVHLKLMGAAMANMQTSNGNKLVWAWLDGATKQALGAKPEDTDGIAGQTMLVEGVKIGVFLDERPEEGVVKISFRGRNGYNVGALAAEFGGGGHYAASGCTVSGTLADVLPKALAAAERVIAETEAKLHG